MLWSLRMKHIRPALAFALTCLGFVTVRAQTPVWPKATPAEVTAAGLGVQITGADYGNGTFVLAVYFGGTVATPAITPAVYTSPDGTAWTRRTLPVTGARVSHVRFINGKFYLGMDAATNNIGVPTGANGAVLSSVDGITWTAATLTTPLYGPDDFTSGNGVYLASANSVSSQSTQIITSTDGVSWTPRAVSAGTYTHGIAFSNGKFFVAVSGGTTSGLYSSADGVTWTRISTAPASAGHLTASPAALLVNYGTYGNYSQALTTDGVTFTTASPGIPLVNGTTRYINGAFVAPALTNATEFISNQARASYDGRTWSTIATAALSDTQDVREIAYGNGRYVFVGEFDIFTGTTTVVPGGTGTPPPAITAQPTAAQSVAIGGSVTFTITVTGTGVTYQWYFNGIAISGAVNFSFTLGSVTAVNAGSYTVTVTNAGGTLTSSPSVLTVTAAPNTAPSFTTQPAPQAVTAGSSASFTVVAFGSAPLTYQWKKDGVAIVGATSATFTIGAASAADAGNYTVVVTNGSGTVTSNVVSLTVSTTFSPVITKQPLSHTVIAGSSVVASVEAAGGNLTYQWKKNGLAISGATSNQVFLSNAQASAAGSYTVVVTNPLGSVTSSPAILTVNPPGSGVAPRGLNLSVRTNAGTGDSTLIVGAVVGGAGTSGAKPLLIRAVGPTLTGYGVVGALADPSLEFLAQGNPTPIATNDNWDGAAQITSVANAVGAFPFASATSKDAALYLTPASGVFSVKVSGVGGTSGIALAEIYDASGLAYTATTPRFINFSARAQVGAGDGVLIAGFVIEGSAERTVLIRAVGPTLTSYGVGGALADPQLELTQTSGGTAVTVASNDNWGGDAQISAVGASVGAFSLSSATSKDAAILVTLPPGVYSAKASGVGGTTGVALIEVYEVP